MKLQTFVASCILIVLTQHACEAQIQFPGGRIALSHDGNNYDKDDYLAAAMNLALLQATGLKDKLVHFDHSCHLVNKDDRYEEMLESVGGSIKRFDIDASRIFDCQTELDKAIANFKREAEKSTDDNPLWFCIGGPMEVPWRCINAVDPDKRKHIYCLSHSSPFNEGHKSPPKMTHDWEDIKALGAVTMRIRNQNKTDWNTNVKNVSWMRDSTNPDLRWLFSRNAKKKFDSSDSGMLWWVMTGGKNGGDEQAGWKEYKPLLESIPHEATPTKLAQPGKTNRIDRCFREKNGLVVIEAESTTSDLGKWNRKTSTLTNAHCGQAYLEFTGNNPRSGPAESPLAYSFKISKPGLYYIHLRCAREQIGDRRDVANDCYIRLEGDFGAGPDVGSSHGKHASLDLLQNDTKFFGGDHNKFAWATGNKLDPGGHRNKRVAIYNFKASETYRLIVSGRSQKFKLDRIIFQHESVDATEAQQTSMPESE